MRALGGVMHRLSSYGWLALVAVIAPVGCSSSTPQQPDAGMAATPQPAYWGLADKACWRFDDGTKTNPYTVYIAQDSTTIAKVTTFHLAHRLNGFQQRDDWLEVKPDSLLSWRHTDAADASTTPPTPPVFSLYSPAPIVLQQDLPIGQNVDTKTTAKMSTGTSGSMDVMLDFNVIADAQETVMALGAPQSATHYLVTVTNSDGSSQKVDHYWLTPNVGIVQFQPSGATNPYVLTKSDLNSSTSLCVPQ
jgi:hypothetical protein